MRTLIRLCVAVLGAATAFCVLAQERAELYVQGGHTGAVLASAFTPDGQFVVTAGRDTTLRLWQADTGREIRSFIGHSSTVMGIAVFPDGRRVASGSMDRTVRIWDIETGVALQVMTGHTDWVNRVAVSPNGNYVVSSSGDQTLRIWDASSGREVRRIEGAHNDYISGLAWSPDGRMIASGNVRSTARTQTTIAFWDASTGRELRRIHINWAMAPGPKGVSRLAFSPDGRFLAANWIGEDAHVARVYAVGTGSEVAELKGHADSVLGLAFSRDSRLVATASADRTVKIWDTVTWRHTGTLLGHRSGVLDVAFSPDGKRIVTAGNEGEARIWNAASMQDERALKGEVLSKTSIALIGKTLYTGGARNTLQAWSLDTGKLQRRLSGSVGSSSAVFGVPPRRGQLTGHGEAGSDLLGNFLDGFRQYTQNAEFGRYLISGLAASPDGALLAVANPRHEIRLLDSKSGKELRVLGNHASYITALAFSPDGKTLASAARDRRILVWDTVSGNRLRELDSHEADVTAIAFSPDGKRLVSVGWDKKAMVHDVLRARTLQTLELRSGGTFFSVAWSPDGKLIATGDTQSRVMLWDPERGREIRTLEGHANWVTSLAFSPDSRTLYSGAVDGTVRVWESASGRAVRTLTGHNALVSALIPTTDGRLISAGGDGSVRVWDAQSGALIVTLVSFGDGEWVAMTPRGHFNSSENGAKWLTIRVDGNRAYGLDQYQESFFRPDMVTAALAGRQPGESAAAPAPPVTPSVAAAPASAPVAAAPAPAPLATPPVPPPAPAPIASAPVPVPAPAVSMPVPPPAPAPVASVPVPSLAPVAAALQRIPASQRIENIKPAPRVALVDPPATIATEQLTLKLAVADAGGGIGEVRVYLNGSAVLVERTRNLVVEQSPGGAQTFSYAIRLVNGRNQIRAIAFNSDNSMQSVDAMHVIEAKLTRERRPALHAVIVGIQEFENPRLNLSYSRADADLFAETLRANAGGLFDTVNITKLVGKSETSRDKVVQALQAVRERAGPEDLFVFFIASHGTIDDGDYFLVTSNVGSTSSARLRRDAISQNELRDLIANVPATKKFIVLDTCHAGKLGDALQVALLTRGMSEETALKILSRAVGTTILSASTSLQQAVEGYKGHGLFTYVIAEGLKGAADTDKDGFVKTTELADYVDNEVPELAEKIFNHKQYPVISPSGQGFPLSRSR